MGTRDSIIRYWGRKPTKLAQKYINYYTKPNDLVVDYFGGSGIFVKKAVELGRRAVYVDLNPFAHIIAKSTIEYCDYNEFMSAAQTIFKKIDKFRNIFFIRCTCGRYVEVSTILYGRKYIANKRKNNLIGKKQAIFRVIKRKSPISHQKLSSNFSKLKPRTLSLFITYLIKEKFVRDIEFVKEIRYSKRCSCGKENLKNSKIRWVKNPKSNFWYPSNKLEYKNNTVFFKKRDVETIDELFTDRNLWTLSLIWNKISRLDVSKRTQHCLQLAFLSALNRSSKMSRENGGTWSVNCYWIPRSYAVRNPFIAFRNSVNQTSKIIKAASSISAGSLARVISRESTISFLLTDSTKLCLPRKSVDYVIIDPPHTDEVQFFELSLFYTSWLKKRLNFNRELIINPKQGKNVEKYLTMLYQVSSKVYSSLKSYGYYTTILHGNNRRILDNCMETICDAGFRLLKRETSDGYTIYTFKKIN